MAEKRCQNGVFDPHKRICTTPLVVGESGRISDPSSIIQKIKETFSKTSSAVNVYA
jgi:hypothetical protein